MDYVKEKRRKQKKKNRMIRRILMTTLTVMVLVLSGCCIFLLIHYNQEKNRATEAMSEITALEDRLNSTDYITIVEADRLVEEAKAAAEDELLSDIQTYMENGDTTLTLLEKLFPDKIVAADKGRYYFFDINDSLAKNDFNYDDFVYPVLNEETDEYEGDAELIQNGEVTTRKGIDVSKFQGDINWKKVADDGIEFAYIRLGYRGYGSGKIVTDETYEYNITECRAAGIDAGVYFFTEAISEREAIEEADYVLENIRDYDVNLPIVIDVEESASADSRTKDLTREERTDIVIAFCNRIKEAGHDVMIYGNTKSFMIMMDIEKLENYDKWFAYYKYPLLFPYKMRMWQYTDSGEVDGIGSGVDINVAFY